MGVRKSTVVVSGIGEGKDCEGVMGGKLGEETLSLIGSREIENKDVDAFGVGENGESEGGGRRSFKSNCPSRTDCLRAWG